MTLEGKEGNSLRRKCDDSLEILVPGAGRRPECAVSARDAIPEEGHAARPRRQCQQAPIETRESTEDDGTCTREQLRASVKRYPRAILSTPGTSGTISHTNGYSEKYS